jgi:putative transposase
MKAMSRGLHFGKSVMDNANGRFRRRLEEKMAEMGKTFIKEDRFFPSSKRCSCCGRVKAYLPLNERTYRCECGYVEDRDVNAAINLKMEGIRILGAV